MKKDFYILIFLLCLAGLLDAQNMSDLNNFQFNSLHEEIILITDKDLYISGEKIWFSSFYLQNRQFTEKEHSKVLYVELFSSKKDIIWRGKFSMEGSGAAGMINIPSEIFSGTYFLRAYTQFQKNYSPECFFTKAIRIINPDVAIPAPNQVFDDEIIISTAGGKLISEIENFVALKMKNGLTSLISSIWISDQFGNTIATPVLFKNGLGYVYLKPDDSIQYYLKMALNEGDTIVKEFPRQTKTGVVMSTLLNEKQFVMNIIGNDTPSEKLNSAFHLKIISVDKIIVDTVLSENEITFDASFFKNELYLCELSGSQNKVLDRKYFIGQIQRPKQIDVQLDKEIYVHREKVELALHSDSEDYESTIVSVAVTERNANFHSTKLLPNYLFENPILIPFYLETNPLTDPNVLKQLEIILQLNSNLFRNIYGEKKDNFTWPPETSDISITALLRNKKSKEPISGQTVYVSVLGSEPQLHVNKTKNDGLVYFSLTHSTYAKDIFLSAESQDDEEIELLLLNDFSGDIPDFIDVPLQIDTSFKSFLEENWKTVQVENQYKVLEKLITTEELPAPSRFGKPDYHIETKDFIELTNVEELFKELVPYTRLKKKADEFYFEVMDPAKNAVYDDPLILLDDIPIFNYNSLASLPFSIIEFVEVFNKQYIYGDFVFNGLVLIKTKTDNFAGLVMPYGSVFAVYQTITPELTLQFPEYSTTENKQSSLPDFRTLLFWEPGFVLSRANTGFTFYTSDHSTEYDVVVRGITKDGNPCFGSTSFKVISKKTK